MASSPNWVLYTTVYPAALIALICTLSLAARHRVPAVWFTIAAVLALVSSATRFYYLTLTKVWNFDHRLFWLTGRDVWAGIDPYAPERFSELPIIHPPSTLPLFAAFAALPEPLSGLVVTVLYTLLALGLVGFALAVLAAQDPSETYRLTLAEIGAVSAAVALSEAATATLQLGQLSILAAFCLYGALYAQARRWPVVAGCLLAISTMKIGTLLPFLMLFRRKDDRLTWLVFAAGVLILCCASGHPERLPEQCRNIVHRIGELAQPGAVNDISYQGPYNGWILGFDHAFYRVGIHSRQLLSLLQAVALLLLGVFVWRVSGNAQMPRALGISLVCLYSLLFLYHRLYDAVILALPLVYAVARASLAPSAGRARWLYGAAALSMLLILFMRRGWLDVLTVKAPRWPVVGRLIETLVLPYATWLTVAAMVLLWLAVRAEPEGRRQGEPTPLSAHHQTT